MKPGFYWIKQPESIKRPDRRPLRWDIAEVFEGHVYLVGNPRWVEGALDPGTIFVGPILPPVRPLLPEGTAVSCRTDWRLEQQDLFAIVPGAPNLPQGEPQPAPTTNELSDRMGALEAKLAAVFDELEKKARLQKARIDFALSSPCTKARFDALQEINEASRG